MAPFNKKSNFDLSGECFKCKSQEKKGTLKNEEAASDYTTASDL